MTRPATAALLVALSVAGVTPAPVANASPATPAATSTSTITRADLEGAQTAWCQALVGIGAEHKAGRDAGRMANQVLSTAYNYDAGPVLFKPTLTHGAQTFRTDKRGARAYFVGGDAQYPDDKGFALKGWTSCRHEIKATFMQGDVAMAMGNVHLEDANGQKVTVDKTFGYVRRDGALRIVLHHSSLPYVPPAS